MKHQPVSRPFLLLLLIGALTAGIFGMHGLVCTAGTSGTEHRSTSTSMGTSNAPPGKGGMVGNKTTAGAAASSPMTAQAMAEAIAGPAGTDMGDMLMLCIAILTVASGALLALLTLRRLCRRIRGLLPPGTFGLRPVLAHVRSGPPPAWRFSVIRC